jgi:hypothetical protein
VIRHDDDDNVKREAWMVRCTIGSRRQAPGERNPVIRDDDDDDDDNVKREAWMVRCTTGSRRQAPGERNPVIRDNDDNDVKREA